MLHPREQPADNGEGWGRGRHPCPPPTALPPTRRLPSSSRRPASRCPGPCHGHTPGSTQARNCMWTSSLPGNHWVCGQDSLLGRPAIPESRLSMGLAIEAASQSVLVWGCCPSWHGGSHLPGGPHCHHLQRPPRLLAAALGHSLLGLPLPLCQHRLPLQIQSQLQPWPLSREGAPGPEAQPWRQLPAAALKAPGLARSLGLKSTLLGTWNRDPRVQPDWGPELRVQPVWIWTQQPRVWSAGLQEGLCWPSVDRPGVGVHELVLGPGPSGLCSIPAVGTGSTGPLGQAPLGSRGWGSNPWQ